MIDNISVVIIASNREKTIKQCLDSIKEFKEVILYLNNSNDKTESIAKTFSNVKIIKGDFLGFGKTKNRAVDFAANDWVFSLDSDECMEASLVEELKYLNLDSNYCYRVNRKNLFLGKWVKHSGWNPDYITRLFNRKKTQFKNAEVHESVNVNGFQLKKLKSSIIHYAVNDLNDFLLKTHMYSKLKREKKLKKLPPLFIFLRALFAFFRDYFLKLGFLDGYRGLVIAVSDFNNVFFKYMNRYIEQDDLSH